jgi:hypothetical protein
MRGLRSRLKDCASGMPQGPDPCGPKVKVGVPLGDGTLGEIEPSVK